MADKILYIRLGDFLRPFLKAALEPLLSVDKAEEGLWLLDVPETSDVLPLWDDSETKLWDDSDLASESLDEFTEKGKKHLKNEIVTIE